MMHIPSRSTVVQTLGALGIALLCGCSSTEAASSSSSPDGGVGDGGTPGPDAGDAARPFRAPGCPDALPAAGTPCTLPSPVCEYGDTPHCTTFASCGASAIGGQAQWLVSGPSPSCGGNPVGCPAAFGAVASGAACPVSATCTYAEGRCACAGCVTDAGASSVEWECRPWLEPAGCPAVAPLIGTACASAGQECAYGAGCCAPVDVGRAIKCVDGYWQGSGVNGGCACARQICGQ